MHLLEAGDPQRPCVLLLHGFPELAYSWRKVMPVLADAGHYVIAPDQRGYGGTTGWDVANLASFALKNIATDAVALLEALRIEKAHLVGHDFGSFAAGAAALLHADVFRSVVFMSAPFAGPGPRPKDPDTELAQLDPPRKHYQWYYSKPHADRDMRECAQGLHAFLRAYYHMKSADWARNRPHALKEWSAQELSKLPRYYIMDRRQDMAQTVAPHMPARAPQWLTDDELAVYSRAFERTTFQGGLNWYRCATEGLSSLEAVKGRKVEIPACYIAGTADWGVYQNPGAYERMQSAAVCTDWRGAHLIEGAGHWVQQEKPEPVAELLLEFLQGRKRS